MSSETLAPPLCLPPRAVSSLQRSRQRMAWLLVAPSLLVLLAIAGLPLLRTFWMSLSDAQLADLSSRQFVGLANYIGDSGVLSDPEWWGAVRNTLWFALMSVGMETVLGLGIALMLNHPSRLKTLLRAAVLVPWAIPTVVSAKMWSWMLHDQFGVINAMLLALGLIGEPLAWTADPDLAFATIVLVDVWKTTPFMALLILAALQMVPSDCYEAARVDGVPKWSVFLHLTLPLITPAVLVAMIFRTLDALRVFDLIYVMTSNSRTTKSMSVYVREQMIDFQLVGYGSAAATLLFLIIALITLAYMALARRRMEGH
ncbi:carbohydrate ABC transporter permease [Vogesella indigofera]|jgi:trehalose/maltose transport system permease protein|uniref:carbohydrate ABC transporter permease n=1 Tax=Vogesella indigofera TaxID=45465 RepID=UPI001766B487|nr:sugar ABC transporter permease [Vogesella indigofera]MDC7699314.1 sugar ABC transporter permease [Vogesella indigofera]